MMKGEKMVGKTVSDPETGDIAKITSYRWSEHDGPTYKVEWIQTGNEDYGPDSREELFQWDIDAMEIEEAHQRGPIGPSMDAKDDAGIPNMIIDLGSHRAGNLDESWLTMFGEATKLLMKGLMGNFSVPVKVKGTPSEISSFSNALGKEKRYLQAISKYGLNDPRTYKNKGKLEKAVSQFERATNLRWPFSG